MITVTEELGEQRITGKNVIDLNSLALYELKVLKTIYKKNECQFVDFALGKSYYLMKFTLHFSIVL